MVMVSLFIIMLAVCLPQMLRVPQCLISKSAVNVVIIAVNLGFDTVPFVPPMSQGALGTCKLLQRMRLCRQKRLVLRFFKKLFALASDADLYRLMHHSINVS